MSTMINYDVADYLRTEGGRAAYSDAWLKHSPDDAAGIVRAKADVARVADLIKLQGSKDENKGN
jgi:DNA-binding phage protein